MRKLFLNVENVLMKVKVILKSLFVFLLIVCIEGLIGFLIFFNVFKYVVWNFIVVVRCVLMLLNVVLRMVLFVVFKFFSIILSFVDVEVKVFR